MPKSRNKQIKRAYLFKKDPYCYYCKKPLVLFWLNNKTKESELFDLPQCAATLDHIYSKNHPKRALYKGMRGHTNLSNNNLTGNWVDLFVLACRKCNKEKG